MDASCEKILPFPAPKIDDQISGKSLEKSPHILISENEYLELKCYVGYWRVMHKKAIAREEKLKQKILKQEGQIRDLRNRIFGKKSEKKNSSKDNGKPKADNPKRPRGQQPGSEGHGTTERPDLPEKEEKVFFPECPTCPDCGMLYIFDQSKNTETQIIEVEVRAYTRKIIREAVIKGCSCSGVPNTITAPMPPKIMPKSPYGISIWEAVLLTKFHYCQPTNRLLNQYKELGLPISAGTISGGLKKLKDLFVPIYEGLYNHQMTENRFHKDESGWKVFETVEGKVGNRWWLWVSRSASAVYFQIAPGRGADVPVEFFKNTQKDEIIVICDRYSAYKSLAKQIPSIILAFCWAHVRRDFLDAARKYPDIEEWALCWVGKIGELYHINSQRCTSFDQTLPLLWQPESFKKKHEDLIDKMDKIVKERDTYIESHNPDGPNSNLLSDVKCKILESLKNHWDGLSIFIKHPEVPMDNNKGENAIRNPVTGRKNFYGSGSLWSSELAAMMFSIFKTMGLWKINCHHWLNSYLTACAVNQGKVPEELSDFLPWNMDEARRKQLSKPLNTS